MNAVAATPNRFSLDPQAIDSRFSASNGVGPAKQYAIEQFLYFEAALLDEGRLEEWLGLLTDDVRYLMPLRRNTVGRSAIAEWTGLNELCYFDEDKAALELRVRKLRTGYSWAEDPASRTRHMVTNIRAVAVDDDSGYVVQCAFHCYRGRAERQTDSIVGKRHDVLRHAAGPAGFAISRRTLYVDQATLLSPNISYFL